MQRMWRKLKETFTNGLDDETIIVEIIKELTTLKDTSEASSEQVLMWIQKEEAQRAQNEVLDNIKDAVGFNSVRGDNAVTW